MSSIFLCSELLCSSLPLLVMLCVNIYFSKISWHASSACRDVYVKSTSVLLRERVAVDSSWNRFLLLPFRRVTWKMVSSLFIDTELLSKLMPPKDVQAHWWFTRCLQQGGGDAEANRNAALERPGTERVRGNANGLRIPVVDICLWAVGQFALSFFVYDPFPLFLYGSIGCRFNSCSFFLSFLCSFSSVLASFQFSLILFASYSFVSM